MIPSYIDAIRDGDAATQEEVELLYALVRALKPETCLETGTHKGLSATYIAHALTDNNKGHLFTYDPYDWGQPANFQKLPADVKERLTYIRERGDSAKLTTLIDFAFIDGYHGIKDVLEEWKTIEPQLSKNAVVVFHDCDDEPTNNETGVNAAIVQLGLKNVYLPTKNRIRIYEHGNT